MERRRRRWWRRRSEGLGRAFLAVRLAPKPRRRRKAAKGTAVLAVLAPLGRGCARVRMW